MQPDADPPQFDMHPLAFGALCMIGAALWLGCFKLLTAACRATSALWGLGQ